MSSRSSTPRMWFSARAVSTIGSANCARGVGRDGDTLGGDADLVHAAGGRVVVLDREARGAGLGEQRHRLGDAARVVRVAPFAVHVEGQVRRRRELGHVSDELVARDRLVVLAESPREAGTRRRERLEAARGEKPRRADVPRVRHHEQPVRGVQCPEPVPALCDCRHASTRASSRFPFPTTGWPCETSTCSTGRSSSGSSVARRASCVALPSHR